MDQQLLLGIALIVVGIAVGLIAAAVIVNRRIDAQEQEGGVMTEEPAEERASPQPATPEAAADAEPPAQPPSSEMPEVSGADKQWGDAGPGSLLGELHRDPNTGRLFFRSGGKEYRSATDIEDRAQRDRLAGAANEWVEWFKEAPRPAASAPQSPTGMVQAIDAILQRSLQSSGASNRGVRLIQDLSGGVKVLIGVKSYEVEEVPDDEIRRLIRQAVAEWEEQR